MNYNSNGVMLLVAGLFGSLLAVGKNSSANLRENVLAIGAGLSSAYFLTPFIFGVMNMSATPQVQSGVAFLLGVLGLRGVEMIINKAVPGDANVKHDS
jgi:hypothetical protein